jgi:flagellar biosynthesis protein FlhG
MRSLLSRRPPPSLSDRTDQAAGLRRLFSGGAHQRYVPVVTNPHVSGVGALLEQLTAALAAQGCNTLVIDAAESAAAPAPAVLEDPALGIEPLGNGLSYLAARGLLPQLLEARGSAAQWLQRLARAAPQYDVLMVHAGAAELSRFLEGRALSPLLLAAEDADSLAHALASLRLLATRHRCAQFDLLLGAPMSSPQAARAVRHLAGCARSRPGVVLREGVAVDPVREADPAAVPPALARLATALLKTDEHDADKGWHPGSGDAAPDAAASVRN